jgi:hypothetical protein
MIEQRFEVNSWCRCKTGLVEQGEPQARSPVIIVEQDLNTLAEDMDTREFTVQEIAGFYASMPEELAQMLDLYFPGRGNIG